MRAARERLAERREELAKLDLTINEAKTKLMDFRDGAPFDFLGYTFRWVEQQQNPKKKMVLCRPQRDKRARFLRELSQAMRRQPVQQLLLAQWWSWMRSTVGSRCGFACWPAPLEYVTKRIRAVSLTRCDGGRNLAVYRARAVAVRGWVGAAPSGLAGMALADMWLCSMNARMKGMHKEISMALMRRQEFWDPWREMEALTNRMMNRFLGTPGGRFGEREALAVTDWSPACDISETDKEYCVQAELPNVNKEDVHVTLEEGILTIQGERREAKEEKGVRYHRRELSYGSFLRRFTLPEDVDESKVDATFKDGILNVVIPKTETKTVKAKEIEVH